MTQRPDPEREGTFLGRGESQLRQDWSHACAAAPRTCKWQGPKEGKAVPSDESQAAHLPRFVWWAEQLADL